MLIKPLMIAIGTAMSFWTSWNNDRGCGYYYRRIHALGRVGVVEGLLKWTVPSDFCGIYIDQLLHKWLRILSLSNHLRIIQLFSNKCLHQYVQWVWYICVCLSAYNLKQLYADVNVNVSTVIQQLHVHKYTSIVRTMYIVHAVLSWGWCGHIYIIGFAAPDIYQIYVLYE